MDRKEFIKKSLALGVGFPFMNFILQSCSEDGSNINLPNFQTNFSGKVLVIGAGAAGLAAGYILNRYGVDFEILEANPVYGGRVKRDSTFADFPIDLGAEWIHESPSVLANIISNPQVNANLDLIVYNPQSIKTYVNGSLNNINIASNYYSEYKFKRTTWLGFFEQYLVPNFTSKIRLNTPITQINYSGSVVRATDINNNVYEGNKVLITVPINVLKSNVINFTPALSSAKVDAINGISMGDGIKVFIEFSERFYPDILLFDNIINAAGGSIEKTYYDAAFRKNSSRNILGLFAVQQFATPYTSLGSDQERINFILKELDEVFGGRASKAYVRHTIQNWSAEPYILGSYSSTFNGDVDEILTPVDNKVYFAGEALDAQASSTVHGACQSAYDMVQTMLTT